MVREKEPAARMAKLLEYGKTVSGHNWYKFFDLWLEAIFPSLTGSQLTWRYDASKTRIQADFQGRQLHFQARNRRSFPLSMHHFLKWVDPLSIVFGRTP